METALTKKFIIKHWEDGQYVTLYPKTLAEQVIQNENGRFVTDAQIQEWTDKQDALGFTPENSAKKGKANGYPSLDENAKIPVKQLPNEAIVDVYELASEAEMLACGAQQGDICFRTDTNETFILKNNQPTLLENWKCIVTNIGDYVTSINGETGDVEITTEKINAVNTSEVVTTATANKILKLDADAKLPASITGDAATVNGKKVDDTKATNGVLWTGQKITTEIQNAVSAISSSLDWKESVDKFADLATAYPNPEDGWTANVKDTNITYRYDGTKWVAISANAIPNVSATVDGLMIKEDKVKLDNIEERANFYEHPENHDAEMIVTSDERMFVSKEEKEQFLSNTTYTNDMPTVSALGGIGVGTTFDNVSISDLLTSLLYPYVAPTISFNANPGNQTREFGNPITSVALTANTGKKSKPITTVEFLKDNAVIHTVAAPKANGGSETFTYSTPITTNAKLKARVGDGQQTVTSGEVSYTFVYPMYVGSVKEQSPTQEAVKAMTKIVATKGNRTQSHTLTDARFCFAYPKSYGNLKSVLDANNFEVLGDFVKEEKAITCLDGTDQTYYVYTFKNVVTMSNFNMTYKF